ncbi:hypothetical protein L0244_16035 [bacterium]|nr:hypothetical protein [bacterium]
MKIVSLGLILTAIFLFAGCNDDDEGAQTGSYRYTAFLNNSPVVEGTIQIDSLNTQNVSGQWDFHAVGDERNDVGPQIGSGNFTGSFDGAAVTINLNPEMADNNVTLHGTFTGDTIRGEWSFSGFAGVINHGPFMAQREK